MGKNAPFVRRVGDRRGHGRALAAALVSVPLVLAGYIAAPNALGAGDGLSASAFAYSSSEYTGVPTSPGISRTESGRTACATGTVTSVNTDWGLGAVQLSTGSGTCGTDYTLVHAQGYLTMAGTYTGGTTLRTFYSASNDGFSLALTDPTTGATTQVIDNWAVQAAAPAGSYNAIGSMTVKPGLTYDVDIWYFDLQGASSLVLAWDEGGVPVTVPDAALSTVRPLTAQPALTVDIAAGSPASLTYPSATITTQLTTHGGDGTGATTYAQVSGNCTVSTTGLLTATGAGPCGVQAIRASDGVFASATSATYTLTVLVPQATLTVNVPTQLAFGASSTLTTTGGSGSGAVTYSATGPCTVSGSVITVTSSPGVACTVTAVKSTDGTFDSATATASLATVKAPQATLTAVATGSLTYDPTTPASTTVAVSGGSGSGALTYAAVGPCTLTGQGPSGTTVIATGGGVCSVVATRASDADYLVATATATLTIATANQPAVTVTASSTTLTYRASPPATATLTASGGAGTGAYSFQADPASVGVCSVTTSGGAGTVTALGAGTCKVTAMRVGDANYADAVSAPAYISVAAAVTTTVLVPSLSLTYGVAVAPVTPVLALGGFSPVYTASLPAGLSIDAATGAVTGTPLAATASASYTITATDGNGSTSSSVVTIAVVPATPSLAWLTQPADIYPYGTQPTAATAQVSGNVSPLVYATGTTSVCTVSQAGQFTVLRAGVCQYTVSVAGDANHNAVSLSGQFTVSVVAPSVPTGIALKVETTSLTTTWNPSADDGGSALSSYTVRAASGGVTSTCTADASITSCTLQGLTQGATYVVTVSATNSAVGALQAVTSPQSAPVSAAIPTAQVRFVAGNIAARYDPTPVTSAVDNLSGSQQQALLDAGIVAAPAEAPVVTITANLSATSFDTPVNLSVPQTVDSGSQVRVRLLVPTDTPAGALVHATLTLPSGGRVDLGTTALSSADVAGGLQLGAFAIVTPGDYVMSVDVLSVAAAGPTRGLAAVSTVVHQSIDYAIRIVPGAAGVPLIANAPTPTPTETPTESPTPSPEPTVSQEPLPEPSPSESVDDRGLVIVNPLDNPTSVAKTAVTAVTLVSAVGAAASAAAAAGAAASGAASAGGAAGGASGGGAGGGRSAGGSGGGTGTGSAASGETAGGDDGADSMASVQTVDVEHEIFEDLSVNWGDALPIWSLAGMKYLDRKSHDATVAVAPYSPLLSKLLTDGAYTRALVGVFSAVLPVVSVVMAVLGIQANDGVLLPPPAAMLMTIAVIGVLDAAAGALGIGVFAAGMWISAGVHTKGDVRMLLGLFIVGFGPALLAGAFRGYRRPAAMAGHQWWERVVDLAVAPFVGGWATKGMVDALSSLSGVQLPIAQYSSQIALAVAGTLMLRVVLEEFAAQFFPARLNTIHPTEVRNPSNVQKSIALAMRAGIFFYVADAFVGTGWYLYLGTALFILPNYVGLFQAKFPNYPGLYQFLPAGLPGLATSLLIASATLSLLTRALGETPNLAKFAFAVLPIPSAILAVMGMLGREPREGDVRWYQRPRYTLLYRIGGAAMLVYTIHLAGIY